MTATDHLSELGALFVSCLRVSRPRPPRVYGLEVDRIAEVSARIIEPLFQANSFRCKPRIVSEIPDFIGIVAQVKELRVFFAGCVVLDQLPALVTDHSLTVTVSTE